MRILHDLKGGSLSSTSVVTDGREKFVRKSIAIDANREYGLVRWQSQLRKMQILNKLFPTNTLPIINAGTTGGSYFFDLPYLENSKNLYEALKNDVSEEVISDKLTSLLIEMSSHELQSVNGAMAVYLNEEVKRPLIYAKSELKKERVPIVKQDKLYLIDMLELSIEKTDKFIKKYSEEKIYECVTHGNLTLENVLWDYHNNNVIMIDAYAETYCESVLGDVSQLYQSAMSGYEAVTDYLMERDISILNYPIHAIPSQFGKFAQILELKLSNETWYDRQKIDILRVSQFTRMLPFKIVKNPKLGFLFLNHALDLLDELQC